MKRPEWASDPRERVTDLYLITILLVFPLFPGISGYSDITRAKFVFLLAVTGLWTAALVFCFLRERKRPRMGQAQWMMAAFLAFCLLSWWHSPWRERSFLGAGRYDGLLSALIYGAIFLGVSSCARPKRLHAAAFALGMGLCCVTGMLQLFGRNPLYLFPAHTDYGQLSYYDAGTLYSGVYLGTIGNTNILDAALCCALPLFAALYIGGEGALFLLPLAPGGFVLASAGGQGAAAALGLCALCVPPLLMTDPPRLRRGLRAGALALASVAAALLWQPRYVARTLLPRIAFSAPALGLLLLAAAALGASLLPPRFFASTERRLRRVFLALDAAAAAGFLALAWFWQGESGALYELHSVLHGRIDDSFGSSRVLIWRRCLALAAERPLLGGGPGTLALRLDLHFSRRVPETGATLNTFVDNAHNVWLGWLVNCGVFALLALIALLIPACREALRRRREPMTAALALAVLGGAVHGCFGLGLCLSEPFFWAVLALLCTPKEVIPCPNETGAPSGQEPGSPSAPSS